eukprot:scaffold201_cov405-Prasinococcus_capsulatus_cf.AAC.53
MHQTDGRDLPPRTFVHAGWGPGRYVLSDELDVRFGGLSDDASAHIRRLCIGRYGKGPMHTCRMHGQGQHDRSHVNIQVVAEV